MAAGGPLTRPQSFQVMRWLRERVNRRVSLDVWTRPESGLVLPDRDPCTHCDDVQRAMRQLSTLHPAIQFTGYDLERHADRAAEASIDLAPTTVIRGSGRSIQCVGLFSGLLFPALLDLIWFASTGRTPMNDQTRGRLAALDDPVEVEVMLVPYDAYSGHMARLVGALGVESRRVRVRLVEAAEFPVLASRRMVEQVPLLTINGRRFIGAWEEQPLVEQIIRVVEGNDEPVIRDRIYAAPFYTEEQVREILREQAQAAGQQPPAEDAPLGVEMPEDDPVGAGGPADAPQPEPGPGSGLIVPGQE
jgi:hypothetical protein